MNASSTMPVVPATIRAQAAGSCRIHSQAASWAARNRASRSHFSSISRITMIP